MEIESNILVKKSCNFFSPLRYPGGKSSLSAYFTKILSCNNLKTIYAEAYAGGAGASFELLFNEKVDRIIINDFDKSIYAIWHSILYDTKRFIQKIRKADLSIEEWHRIRKSFLVGAGDTTEIGYSAFYLNRTNRSGIITAGPIGGLKQLGKWKLNARFNKEKLIERVERIAAYRNRITVTNLDGIDFIDKYKTEKDIFIYIDPPYYVKGSSLYYSHYGAKDHVKLANYLSENVEANWILTYDNVSEIRELYSRFRMRSFDLNYHASKPRIGNEIMIFSDSLKLNFDDLSN